MQVSDDAVMWGWKEIAEVFGLSHRKAPEIAQREGWPVIRIGEAGGRVMMTGRAFHAWAMARALGVPIAAWRKFYLDRAPETPEIRRTQLSLATG